MNRAVWERWTPRVEDYWETFSAPYRSRLTELIDKATPPGGSVMDFGCGVGVQSFLLRQRRPDILIYAIDCNKQAQNLTRVLCGNDEKLVTEDTPTRTEQIRQVDTFVSVFTCTYLHPQEIERILPMLIAKACTLIFCEPTCLIDPPHIREYAGMPTGGYIYPYGHWLRQLGCEVEVEVINPGAMLNAVTVARVLPREGGLAVLE